MTKSVGEKEELKKIIREVLDVFSETSLEHETNREIIAETITKDIYDESRVSGRLW